MVTGDVPKPSKQAKNQAMFQVIKNIYNMPGSSLSTNFPVHKTVESRRQIIKTLTSESTNRSATNRNVFYP